MKFSTQLCGFLGGRTSSAAGVADKAMKLKRHNFKAKIFKYVCVCVFSNSSEFPLAYEYQDRAEDSFTPTERQCNTIADSNMMADNLHQQPAASILLRIKLNRRRGTIRMMC